MTPEDRLRALGFTEIEALTYCRLLRSSPSTGYKLAREIGKAPANTYQALSSLAQKGAVLMDKGATKLVRAVPPTELLSQLQNAFEERRDAALTSLDPIQRPAEEDRIYSIESVSQTYERAKAMIAGAQETLLFDIFPSPLEKLKKDLARAAKRGVLVAGIVYGRTESSLNLLKVTCRAAAASVIWPGDQLTLVSDAQEHLVALISRKGDEIHHCVWSDSAYLSALQHSGLSSEIRLIDVAPNADDRLSGLALLQARPPGLRTLMEFVETEVDG